MVPDQTNSPQPDTHLKHRESLEASRLSICRDRDKLILAIAGGSLAVSVALLEKVIENLTPVLTYVLVAGWTLEVLSIAFTLFSLHSSERALWHERERTDCMICGDGKDPGWANPYVAKTDRLNNYASFSAVAGLALILFQGACSILASQIGNKL